MSSVRPYLLAAVLCAGGARSQDTFSIVAVDTISGEVGSAGASCVDLFAAGISDIGFLGDLLPGIGAINTQAYYNATNQANARARMQVGDTPAEIIAWLQANDAQGVPDANNRQYGAVRLIGVGAQAAAHTGSACQDYAGHRTGAHYAIQGNILLGPEILDQMETNFLNTPGTLAQKLMAALQGANVVGADTRCADNNSSSLFAFLKVAATGDPDGDPYISLGVRTADGAQIEPIDSLQNLFNASVGMDEASTSGRMIVFPDPASTAITVQMPERSVAGGELQLHDQSGRRIFLQAWPTAQGMLVDVSGLDPGIYHLSWTSEGSVRARARFVRE